MPYVYIVHNATEGAIPPVSAHPTFGAAMHRVNEVYCEWEDGYDSKVIQCHEDIENDNDLGDPCYMLTATNKETSDKLVLSVYKDHIMFVDNDDYEGEQA